MFKRKTIDELSVGDKHIEEITIGKENVEAFAKATGDFNPLHMDDEFAKDSQFGKRVVHGVLLPGIISGILGTKFPGLGTVAREMTAKFSRPVFIGETVKAEVEVTEMKKKYNICTIKYKITNQQGKTAVRGKAVVLPKRDK
ncbi:MAG: MaoC family dehydratase [Elusimicrobiota bacterium]